MELLEALLELLSGIAEAASESDGNGRGWVVVLLILGLVVIAVAVYAVNTPGGLP